MPTHVLFPSFHFGCRMLAACLCLAVWSGHAGRADEPAGSWPQLRGPGGRGHSDAAVLPVRWSASKNVVWKTRVPGHGWSSPVIAEGQVWLTTALDDGRSLRALCVDRETGEILHDVEVFRPDDPGRIHPKNSHATPTPVIDGGRVFVHFGAHGTACLSSDGDILWTTEMNYYHHHGPGASPVLAEGVLVVPCDGFTRPFYDMRFRVIERPQFVVGLDPSSGERRWTRPRDGRHSYCTPLTIEVDGRTQVVSPGGNRVAAYDPETGEELWWCRYDGYSVVPQPVFGHGLVFVCTGYDVPTLVAIRPDGRGDVTDTHVAWQARRGVPLNPSPLLVGDDLYLVSDNGVATCLDARTGRQHWQGRLGGNFSAAPLYADGKIYLQSEAGVMHVIEPGPRLKKLAANRLGGRTLASPAAAGRSLFVRNDRFLYRIEDVDAPQ